MKKSLIFAICLIPNLIFGQLIKPVKWSYASKMMSKTEVLVYIKATIEKDWHIYSSNMKDGGPAKTRITFKKSKRYTLTGKLLEPKPIQKFEEVYGMNVNYFLNEVVFTRRVKFVTKPFVIKGSVEYMACTDEKCLPPDVVEFSIPVK